MESIPAGNLGADLRTVLGAFARVVGEDEAEWTGARAAQLERAFITSTFELHAAVNEPGLVDRLRRAGCVGDGWPVWRLETVLTLRTFVPSRLSNCCLAHAWEAVLKVEENTARTTYSHRGEAATDRALGDERYLVPGARACLVAGRPPTDEAWELHVDCAGFVRNVYETVTGCVINRMTDRPFMRAADFARFFEARLAAGSCKESASMWRAVNDVRAVLPGDIIAYKFGDFVRRNTLRDVVGDVGFKLFLEQDDREGAVRRVFEGEDDRLLTWMEKVEAKLGTIGVDNWQSLLELIERGSLNSELKAQGKSSFMDRTLGMLRAACVACREGHGDTGHVVIAASAAERRGGDWRVLVLHSTSGGQQPGVQRGFHRFRADGGVWVHSRTERPVAIGRMV